MNLTNSKFGHKRQDIIELKREGGGRGEERGNERHGEGERENGFCLSYQHKIEISY